MKPKYVYLSLLYIFSVITIYGCGTQTFSLAMAIGQNDTEKAKQILKDKNASNFVTYVHLEAAVLHGQTEIVKAILDAGVNADLSNPNSGGRTPLMNACILGYPDICKILIEGGANVHAKDENGWTPIMLSSNKESETIGLPGTIIGDSKDKIEITNLLLGKGADSNIVNDFGFPLLFAVRDNFTEMIKLLLDRGADVNLKSKSGNTALIEACSQGSVKITKYLIENGAKINDNNNIGHTPYMFASGKGQTELATYLISQGADINSEDRYGVTPYFLAASGGHWQLTEILLKKKAKIDIVDYYPYETAKSHKFIVENYLEKFDNKMNIIKFYTIAADYFKKAAPDLEEKSEKLVYLKLRKKRERTIFNTTLYFQSLKIFTEDLAFIFDRYPYNVDKAIAAGLSSGFNDSKIKMIQAEFKRKAIESNKLSNECYSIVACYNNFSSEQEIVTCVKSAKE